MALKIWAKFDEGSLTPPTPPDVADGDTAADSSGFGNDGLYENHPPSVFGQFTNQEFKSISPATGSGLAKMLGVTPTFGGGQDTPGFSDVRWTVADLDFNIAFPGGASFTVECWINVPSTCSDQQSRGLLGASRPGRPSAEENWGWRVDYQGVGGLGFGPAWFSFWRGAQLISPPPDNLQITTDIGGAGWIKVRTVYDGSDMEVYFDDALVGTRSSVRALSPNYDGFYVGGAAFGVVFGATEFLYCPTVNGGDGTGFDELRVWDTAERPAGPTAPRRVIKNTFGL